MAVVVLDLGHTGRTRGRAGAEHDGLRETSIVRQYVCRAADVLEAHGVTVEITGAGSYGSRQRYAATAGASAFIACHVNAGWREGYKSAIFHELGALGGRRLAVALGHELDMLTGSHRIHQTEPHDWTKHAHGLISQTGRVPAVVYEPVFIDAPHHRDLCEHPAQIGDSLAAGVLSYLQIR